MYTNLDSSLYFIHRGIHLQIERLRRMQTSRGYSQLTPAEQRSISGALSALKEASSILQEGQQSLSYPGPSEGV